MPNFCMKVVDTLTLLNDKMLSKSRFTHFVDDHHNNVVLNWHMMDYVDWTMS